MTLPVWSFNGIPFYPVDSSRVAPRWQRQARIQVHNLLGTGVAEFHTFGYQEYRLQVEIFMASQSQAFALENNLGLSGTLAIGDATWTNVILMSVTLKIRDETHVEGSLEFARSGV